MFCLLMVAIVTISGIVAIEEETKTMDNQVNNFIARQFKKGSSDFSPPQPNSKHFPPQLSMDQNRLENYPVLDLIDNDNFNVETDELMEKTGFHNVTNAQGEIFFNNLVKQLTTAQKQKVLSGSVQKIDVVLLPESWQYFTTDQTLNSMKISGKDWADIVNYQPLNLALLYRVAIFLRNKNSAEKVKFHRNVKIPSIFKEDLGFILGYRWNIEKENLGVEDFKVVKYLPFDRIVSKNFFSTMKLKQLLKNSNAWYSLSPGLQVAWYCSFEKQAGWQQIVGNSESIQIYGHLLGGAPLHKLSELNSKEKLHSAGLTELLKNTDMNPLRVQELWEALNNLNRREIYGIVANKLDSSQLIRFYHVNFAVAHQAGSTLETNIFKHGSDIAFENIILIARYHHGDQSVVTWDLPRIYDTGMFIAALSIPQMLQLDSRVFTSDGVEQLMSDRFTYGQGMVIFGKYLQVLGTQENLKEIVFPTPLLHILPSKLIEKIMSYQWTSRRNDLIKASARMLPSQMAALHKVIRPIVWDKENLAAILANHPPCLELVKPAEFRQNLNLVLDTIKYMAPGRFNLLTKNVRLLPRTLQTAWLEAALESHTNDGEWMWNTSIMLDRPPSRTSKDLMVISQYVENYDSGHGSLFQQIDSKKGSTMMSSLVLRGLSCHCIQRITTSDTLEVMAAYRLNMKSYSRTSIIPRSVRKCWANKIRHYLKLKAVLYNVTITRELGLLSMLNTAEIKTIGGETLLTWGGKVLSGITNNAVMKEVLMEVGQTDPYHYLTNAVDFSDLKLMAKILLDSLLDGRDVNLQVLSQMGNLLPYADERILQASPTVIKMYIQSVQATPCCKAVCISSEKRELLRKFILKGFGSPSMWSPLDLVILGDFLIVLNEGDLSQIEPTCLRRATSQLARATFYTTHLSEVAGSTRPQTVHDTCAVWLGDIRGWKSEEAKMFSNAWERLNQFYIIGAHLAIDSISSSPTEDDMSPSTRKRRQTDPKPEFEYRILYDTVMKIMRNRYAAGNLSEEVKNNATHAITETQKLLGQRSLQVLNLVDQNYEQSEILNILATWKEAKNMTEEQHNKVKDLAVETQILMIQRLVQVLNLTAEDMLMTEDSLAEFMSLETFTTANPLLGASTPAADSEADSDTFNPFTVPSPATETTSIATSNTNKASEDKTKATTPQPKPTEESQPNTELLKLEEELLKLEGVSEPKPGQQPNLGLDWEETQPKPGKDADPKPGQNPDPELEPEPEQEPEPEPEPSSVFNTTKESVLPDLSTVKLECNCLRAAGKAAAGIFPSNIAMMASEEVEACLETLGSIVFRDSVSSEIWTEIRKKVFPGVNDIINGADMILLNTLLPTVARDNPGMLELNRDKALEGISLLGRRLSEDHENRYEGVAKDIMTRYINANNITVFDTVEADSLGQLLCGLDAEQWQTLLPNNVFRNMTQDTFRNINCRVPADVRAVVGRKVVEVYGSPDTWLTSDVASLGWLVGSLTPDLLALVKADSMDGVNGAAVKMWTPEHWSRLSSHSIGRIGPQAASMLEMSQLPEYLPRHKREALRAAMSENKKFALAMDDQEPSMREIDQRKMTKKPELKPERKSLDLDKKESSSSGATCVSSVFLTVSVLFSVRISVIFMSHIL